MSNKSDVEILAKLKEYVKEDLAEVDRNILKLTAGQEEMIAELTNYLISLGGKRLRPILTLLSAKLFGYEGQDHIKLASAIEFIHTATLLHDDVVDNSELRRGAKTANAMWGNKICILVGDFLFSQAFIQMVEVGRMKILSILSNASSIISRGEILQLSEINNLDMSKDQYLTIIRNKTAELFSAATEVGAIVANASSENVAHMREFGLNFGIAYQMLDDFLDYFGQDKLGKKSGDDFAEGKVTLPIIIAYEQASFEEKKFFERTMKEFKQNQEDFHAAKSLLEKYNIKDKCLSLIEYYLNLANTALYGISNSTEKELLISLLEYSKLRLG